MNLSEEDSKKVIAIKKRMAELGPKLKELEPYTRPLGKSQQPFYVAQALENRFNVYSAEYTKLNNQLRRIYRANGMEHL